LECLRPAGCFAQRGKGAAVIWIILGAVLWLSGVVVMFCVCVVAARADRRDEVQRGYPSASDDR
jgi:hypothetical protein